MAVNPALIKTLINVAGRISGRAPLSLHRAATSVAEGIEKIIRGGDGASLLSPENRERARELATSLFDSTKQLKHHLNGQAHGDIHTYLDAIISGNIDDIINDNDKLQSLLKIAKGVTGLPLIEDNESGQGLLFDPGDPVEERTGQRMLFEKGKPKSHEHTEHLTPDKLKRLFLTRLRGRLVPGHGEKNLELARGLLSQLGLSQDLLNLPGISQFLELETHSLFQPQATRQGLLLKDESVPVAKAPEDSSVLPNNGPSPATGLVEDLLKLPPEEATKAFLERVGKEIEGRARNLKPGERLGPLDIFNQMLKAMGVDPNNPEVQKFIQKPIPEQISNAGSSQPESVTTESVPSGTATDDPRDQLIRQLQANNATLQTDNAGLERELATNKARAEAVVEEKPLEFLCLHLKNALIRELADKSSFLGMAREAVKLAKKTGHADKIPESLARIEDLGKTVDELIIDDKFKRALESSVKGKSVNVDELGFTELQKKAFKLTNWGVWGVNKLPSCLVEYLPMVIKLSKWFLLVSDHIPVVGKIFHKIYPILDEIGGFIGKFQIEAEGIRKACKIIRGDKPDNKDAKEDKPNETTNKQETETRDAITEPTETKPKG